MLRTIVTVALRWWWKWLTALLLIIVIDASLDSPAMLRLVLSLMLALSILVFFITEGVTFNRIRRPRPHRFARAIENTLRIKGNPLTNAVFFKTRTAFAVAGEIPSAIQSRPSSTLTTILTRRAITEAERIASKTSPSPTIHRAAQNEINRLHLLHNIVVLLIWSLTLIIAPRLFAFGIPRLIDPLGDHPPFTWLNFDIQLSPAPDGIYLADDVHIRVTITGRGAENLDAVQLERLNDNYPHLGDSKTILEQIPMQPIIDRTDTNENRRQSVWEFALRGIRRNAAFRIRAGNAISKRFDINVMRRPRILSSRITRRIPDYAGGIEQSVPDWSHPINVVLSGSVHVQLRSSLSIKRIVTESDSDDPPPSTNALIPSDQPENADVEIPVNRLGAHSIRIRVADESGRQSKDEINLTFVGIKDHPPTVEITSPARNAAALSTSVIPIEILAQDDLGVPIGALHVEVQHAPSPENGPPQNKSNAPPRPIAFKPQSQNASHTSEYATALSAWNATVTLDLSVYDLKPGDVIRYSAHATDNRGEHFGGAQSAESETYEIIIIDETTLNLLTDENTKKAGEKKEQSQSQSESDRPDANQSSTNTDENTSEARKSEEDLSANANQKSGPTNQEERAGSSSEAAGGQKGATDPSGNNTNSSGDSGGDASDDQNAEVSGNSKTSAINSSKIEKSTDDPNPPAASSARSAESEEKGKPTAPTSQPDKDNLRKQLQEQLKDRIIFGRSVQPTRTPETGSTNPDVKREQHEAMVYEFAGPNNPSRTSTIRKNENENRRKPESVIIQIPSSASLRSIPSQYRDLAVEYFRKVALAESNKNSRAARKRKE